MDSKYNIVFEDNHLLVVNKPAGMLVQGDNTGDVSLIDYYKDYIKEKFNKPGDVYLGLVHRLDRPVSGIVVLARTSKALSRMNKLFREKKTEKVYYAITSNKPQRDKDRLVDYLKKDRSKNKSFVYSKSAKNTKEAILDYELVSESDRYYLLKIILHTGRHHQIRCQLANAGMPIKGDLKYGSPRSNPDGGISLHARELNFVHPVRNSKLYLTAGFPEDKLWAYFESSLF